MKEKIQRAAKLIKESQYIVAFTGAGISVESGIPDFRSPGGLWDIYDPYEYAEYSAFLTHPEKYWKMHRELSQMVLQAEPNPAHLVLADLELKYNKLKAIVTQNVDFLHSRAGNKKVLEIHGSGRTARCLKCSKGFLYTEVQKMLIKDDVPRCPECKGLIKTNTILFGESLPLLVLEEARKEISFADLLIVIGSSLTVYPAASLPDLAKRYGIKLIIINKEPTVMDKKAEIVIIGEAGIILPEILSEFKKLEIL